MSASPVIIDFRYVDYDPGKDPNQPLTGSREPVSFGSKGGIIGRPIDSKRAKQIRQRARRKMKIADDELKELYGGRSIDDWDLEELARGRPRNALGHFQGPAPAYIDRAAHERIVRRFEDLVRQGMNENAVGALKIIDKILNDEETDDKGRPRTAAGTKLDAAKFLIEHVIGKPKQRTETDISVKLQGILGHAMVNPVLGPGSQFELTQGYQEAQVWEDDDGD